MNILFLYSEIAAYFLACARALHEEYGCEVHIVRWPVNPEAPFQFDASPGITFYERAEYEADQLWELFQEIDPQVVYVSGWMDKAYVKVAPKIRATGTPVVCGSDNHWRGDLRQRIATWISPFYLQSRYSHFWVPGRRQYEFARRLGYDHQLILMGMYSADLSAFEEVYKRTQETKALRYPHKFLYVGRYVDFKGIEELVHAFVALSQEEAHDWTLELIGAGPLKDRLPQHERITYRGFVQPKELPSMAEEAGCFVFPSREEPWGVALHEFAGAGLPLITSTACGAGDTFVKHGYNGLIHQAGDQASIRQALQTIVSLADDTLVTWGKRSHLRSQAITPQSWAATLMQVVDQVAM